MSTLAQSFDPRSNSIGFIRWLMAFMVIFSHAGPLGGFYGGRDLGTQWSEEQSLGGVAVGGFFFLSGFLITRSRMGRSSTPRFFWRRILRIFPAFWLTLLTTAFVIAPVAWLRENGTLSGYFDASTDSPLTYFTSNMWLVLTQRSIAGSGDGLPYFAVSGGGRDWNGSAWTLAYEFSAYILIGFLGLIGALAQRRIAGLIGLVVIGLSTMQWLRIGDLAAAMPLFTDPFVLLMIPPFVFGMLFTLFAEKIPLNGRVATAALVFAVVTYGKGGWLVLGQYAFFYFLIWFAVRARALRNWEKYGDFSYGIYIFAWPIMQLCAYFGIQNRGWLTYHLTVILLCHVAAFASWHLIEKPALELKNWTPRPIEILTTRARLGRERFAAGRRPARPPALRQPDSIHSDVLS